MTVPFALSVTRRTPAASTHVAGVWVDGAYTESTIQASVQPAGAEELERLDEGDRTKGAVGVWSETELTAGNEATGTKADQIQYLDEWWEVKKVEPYIGGHHTSSLSHYAAVAVRVDR